MWCFHRKSPRPYHTLSPWLQKIAKRTRRRAMELQPRKHHASMRRIRAKNDQVSLEDTFSVTQTFLHSLYILGYWSTTRNHALGNFGRRRVPWWKNFRWYPKPDQNCRTSTPLVELETSASFFHDYRWDPFCYPFWSGEGWEADWEEIGLDRSDLCWLRSGDGCLCVFSLIYFLFLLVFEYSLVFYFSLPRFHDVCS